MDVRVQLETAAPPSAERRYCIFLLVLLSSGREPVDMDLNHLQAFSMVVESGSISEAVRRLFVSQPSISTKISELEKHFQIKLLERTNKGIKPTRQGLFLYHEGKKMLSMAKNLERGLERASDNISEELSIGASETIGNYLLPCRIIQFRELNPHCKIYFIIDDSSQIVLKISNNTLDIGFVEGPLPSEITEQISREGLAFEKIAEDELVLVASKSIKVFNHTVGCDVLKTMPLILLNRDKDIRISVEDTLSKNDMHIDELNVVMETDRINSVISAIIAGKGFSLLPKIVLLKDNIKQLSFKELTFKYEYFLIYNPANLSRNMIRIFVNLFRENGIEGLCWNLVTTG